jgi:hypothetical protein
MSEVTITVSGLQELNRTLYSYSQQLGDRVVYGALRQGANLMKRELQALVAGSTTVRTGKLRRGFRVVRSRIHNGKASGSMIGLFLTLKKDAFYGRFQNDGWNTAGERRTLENTPGRVSRAGRLRLSRGESNGRATLPGKTNVRGKDWFRKAYASSKDSSAALIVAAAEAGADVVARKVGI